MCSFPNRIYRIYCHNKFKSIPNGFGIKFNLMTSLRTKKYTHENVLIVLWIYIAKINDCVHQFLPLRRLAEKFVILLYIISFIYTIYNIQYIWFYNDRKHRLFNFSFIYTMTKNIGYLILFNRVLSIAICWTGRPEPES